jgi:type II secretion system (T2SS) protein M
MTVSARDKKILMIMVPVAVVLAYWFLLLAPKREAASTAQETLQTEQATLAEAEANANTVNAAKANFARDYAAVVALGKAIPSSVDMPSLLVQLEEAARGTGIELDGVTAGERAPVESAPTGTGTPTAPSGQPPQSAPGAAAADAQSAADSASAGNTASDPSAAGTATAPTDPAAAGAAPAPPALESVSLEFKFKGEFFSLADFFHRLKRFVYLEGDNVRVRGRLMTIDGVEYTADADTFPLLTATVQATVYLSPKTEGVTAGATPAGPQAASVAPVPTTTASGGSSSPTPTATATP